MNLEALALARAEEQMESGAWRVDDQPRRSKTPTGPLPYADPTPRPRAESRTSRALVCDCGNCHTCKNREAMRRRRARWRKPKARCGVKGCRRRVHGNGLCARHYRQAKRWGFTTPVIRPFVRPAHPRTVEIAKSRLAAKGITVRAA